MKRERLHKFIIEGKRDECEEHKLMILTEHELALPLVAKYEHTKESSYIELTDILKQSITHFGKPSVNNSPTRMPSMRGTLL